MKEGEDCLHGWDSVVYKVFIAYFKVVRGVLPLLSLEDIGDPLADTPGEGVSGSVGDDLAVLYMAFGMCAKGTDGVAAIAQHVYEFEVGEMMIETWEDSNMVGMFKGNPWFVLVVLVIGEDGFSAVDKISVMVS